MADEVEQQLSADAVERHKAQFIDNEQIRAPRGLPENSRFLRPITKGRILFSTRFVSGVR